MFLVRGIDLPGIVRVLGPMPATGRWPPEWSRSQVVPAQPALDRPRGGEFGLRAHPLQLDADAAGTPAGMLTAQLECGLQQRRNCQWARPAGMIAGL
jgi:hypothetical protein